MQILAGSDDRKKRKTKIHANTHTQACEGADHLRFPFVLNLWSRRECSWSFQMYYVNLRLTVAHYIHLLIKLSVSVATEISG